MYNKDIKTIDRGITLAITYNDVIYGIDNKGGYYELSCVTQKVKDSIDDYEFVWKWLKLHPCSYHKLDIVILFSNIKAELL